MQFRGIFIQEAPRRMLRVCISFPSPSAGEGAGGKGDFDSHCPHKGRIIVTAAGDPPPERLLKQA